MPNAKVQVVLPATTGLPSDVFINTFHFATSANSAAVGADIVNRLVQFYNTLQAGTSDSVAQYIGNIVDRGANACIMRLYDETPNALPPFYEETWTLGGGQPLADLPWEVACCLSFKNTSVTSSPERNRRGRIYVGPLAIDAQTESGGSIRPAASFMNTLLEAGDALELSNNAMATWVVWSKTLGLSFPVEAGWVDNAFDTQRRRGEPVTARTSLVFQVVRTRILGNSSATVPANGQWIMAQISPDRTAIVKDIRIAGHNPAVAQAGEVEVLKAGGALVRIASTTMGLGSTFALTGQFIVLEEGSYIAYRNNGASPVDIRWHISGALLQGDPS